MIARSAGGAAAPWAHKMKAYPLPFPALIHDTFIIVRYSIIWKPLFPKGMLCMQPNMMCSRCGKNVAVIFITKMENGTTKNEGLCLKCARELGI